MFRLPLFGVRVLDLTMAWAGPYGTRLLADMGAEVIKIETPANWDVLRAITIEPSTTEHVWDRAPFFNHVNRNKYGLSLDLSIPKGRELFLRLVAISDVVIENFRTEVVDNLGLAYDVLREANEGIIFVRMPGHGTSGPERDFVAYGTSGEQLAGLCHLTGYPGGPPQKTGVSYGDPVAGIAAAASVALALWDRRRTGLGQYIEVAQRENLINAIGEFIVGYSMNGREPPRRGNRHSSMAPHGCYPCAGDDQWLTLACEDDAQFAALCGVIGQPALARDPRFADVVSRSRNQDALDEIIAARTATLSKHDAASQLQAAGVPASPVLTVPDILADEHLRARGFFETVAHAVAGTWEMDGPHWRMSETPAHIRIPPPCFAEYNDYVFKHLLGLSDADVAALEADGVTSRTPNPAVHA